VVSWYCPGAMGTPQDAVLFALEAPEARIAGLPSLERLVLTAQTAGCRRVTVVSPTPGAARALIRPTSLEHLEVRIVSPGSAEEGAALARIAAAGQPFLVAHTALALSPGALAALCARAGAEPAALVAAGPPPTHPFAIGVRQDKNDSLAGGPEALTHLVGVALLPAVCAVTLAGGLDHAAQTLRALTVEQAGRAPLRAVTLDGESVAWARNDAERRVARWALVRTTAKASDGIVSHHLNRRLSGALTVLLLDTRVTPNAFTLVPLLLGLGAGWALVQGTHATCVLGALLYHLSSTFDGTDGELARLKFQGSRLGEWLDSVCDQIANLTFAATLPIGLLRRQPDDRLTLWLALIVFGGLITLVPTLFLASRRHSNAANMSSLSRSVYDGTRGSFASHLVRLGGPVLRRDFYAFFFFLLALVGAEAAILPLLTLGLVAYLPIAALLFLRRSPTSLT
jgi:phosphatidylglycerophosphate synthase